MSLLIVARSLSLPLTVFLAHCLARWWQHARCVAHRPLEMALTQGWLKASDSSFGTINCNDEYNVAEQTVDCSKEDKAVSIKAKVEQVSGERQKGWAHGYANWYMYPWCKGWSEIIDHFELAHRSRSNFLPVHTPQPERIGEALNNYVNRFALRCYLIIICYLYNRLQLILWL